MGHQKCLELDGVVGVYGYDRITQALGTFTHASLISGSNISSVMTLDRDLAAALEKRQVFPQANEQLQQRLHLHVLDCGNEEASG